MVIEVRQTLGLENESIAAGKSENRINAMIDIREELLEQQKPKRLHEQIFRCPNIQIRIQDVKTHAPYDSGSKVTAISG